MTDDGYGIGTPFKSSRIGKDVGYKALQKYYERSKSALKQDGTLDRLRQTVKDAMSPDNTRERVSATVESGRVSMSMFRINPDRQNLRCDLHRPQRQASLPTVRYWEKSSRPVFSTSCSRPPEKKHCIPQNSTRNANTNNEAARQILSQELSTRCWTWSMRGLSRNSKESSDGGEKGNCIDNN